MNLSYKEYSINVFNDRLHAFDRVDNLRSYDSELSEDANERYQMSQYGITIENENGILKNVIVGAGGGSTTIHDRSAIVSNDRLFVCCGCYVYALDLPNLNLAWKHQLDSATCFSLYSFKGDIIVHGELDITRIDTEGNKKWEFSARDIFVTPTGEDAFDINEGYVTVTDWEGYKYVLDEHGSEISSK